MQAKFSNNTILIYDSFVHKAAIKKIPDRIWDADSKVWIVPYNKENLMLLHMLGCKFDDELLEKLKEIQVSNRTNSEVTIPIEPMPIKAVPYSHQIEAYNRACMTLGIFKAGELYG